MLTKKQSRSLMRKIQDYAEAVSYYNWMMDQGTGKEPEEATIAMNTSKLELLRKLDALTEEQP